MHKIRIKIWLCLTALAILLSVGGCSLKKEILLEYPVSEESVPVQEEKDDSAPYEGKSGETVKQQENAVIYVYICGEVLYPGVYEMESGDRVYSLVERAGGLTDQADERAVNQAEQLTDGEMIWIPSVDEVQNGQAAQIASDPAADPDNGKVNINTADLAELTTLPGIGEGKAQNILSYREAHGPFESIEDIMKVDGIKEATYTKMKDRITV